MSPWMQTLLPVAAGFAVVLIGILVFKLHAFLALILAALTTAALTPDEIRIRQHFESISGSVTRVTSLESLSESAISEISSGTVSGGEYLIPSRDSGYWAWRWSERSHDFIKVATLHPATVDQVFTSDLKLRTQSAFWDGTHLLVATSNRPRPYVRRPNDIFVSSYGSISTIQDVGSPSIPARIATAFGSTVGEIGILIAFAAIIGMCLLDSGAADRIVRSALKLVGERGAPVAFTGSGFLLAVPVFFDTVFFLMIPLGKAMRLRTGRNYILYVLTIYCGATMAHSLVPPTPGPLLVAESLDVEIGVMMLVGLCVGLVTASYGILHAWLVNRWIDIPLRDTPDMPLADLEKLASTPDHELPPLWLSLLPIVLPVWLIAQATAIEMIQNIPSWTEGLPSWLFNDFAPAVAVLGEKNTALGIGVAIALFLLIWQTRSSMRQVRDRVGMALAAGGSIILITAAGGAFGEIIAQTGVASLIQDLPRLGTVGLLTLAFFVTMTIRTVQGSATVAMITAVGLFAGVEIPVHPVWLALAIGCGSKPISWMTDSGFWVICKMSGMTEAETLKTLTPMTIMMGLVGLATVLVGATLFPLR